MLKSLLLASIILISPVKAADFIALKHPTGGTAAVLTGEINNNDYQRWLEFYYEHKPKEIWLNSIGGSAYAAIKIANFVHANNINTIVPNRTFGGGSSCMSACAIISLAGKTKIMYNDSKIGIHSAYMVDSKTGKRLPNNKDTVTVNSVISHAFGSYGLPVEVSIAWNTTPPEKMKFITPEINDTLNIGYTIRKDNE